MRHVEAIAEETIGLNEDNILVTPEMVAHREVIHGINDQMIDHLIFDIATHAPGKGPRAQIIRAWQGMHPILEAVGFNMDPDDPARSIDCIENDKDTNGYGIDLPQPIAKVAMGNGADGDRYAAISFERVTEAYIYAIGEILQRRQIDKGVPFRFGVASVGYEGITSRAVRDAIEFYRGQGYDLSDAVVNFDSTYHSGVAPRLNLDAKNGFPLDPCNPNAYASTEYHTVWQVSTNSFVTKDILKKYAGKKTVVAAASHPIPPAVWDEFEEMSDRDKLKERETIKRIYLEKGLDPQVAALFKSGRLVDIEMNNEYFTGMQGQGRKFLTDAQLADVRKGANTLIEALKMSGEINTKNYIVLSPTKLLDLCIKKDAVRNDDGTVIFPEQPNVIFIERQNVKPDQMKTLYRAADLVITRTSQQNSTVEAALAGTPVVVINMPGHDFMHSNIVDENYAHRGASFSSETPQPEDLATAILAATTTHETTEMLIKTQDAILYTSHAHTSGTEFTDVLSYAFGLPALN